MLYLAQTLLNWWLAAAALGLVVGFCAPGAGRRLALSAFLVLFCALVAGLHLLPGRYGLWLETALLLVTAYAFGCASGALVGSAFGDRGVQGSQADDIGAAVGDFAAQAGALAAAAPAALAANAEAGRLMAEPPTAPTQPAIAEDIADHPDELAAASPPPMEAGPERPGEREHPGLRLPAVERPANADDEDDLRLIRGIDLALSQELHEIGVWRFSQIAAWTPDHLDWIAHRLRQLEPSSARFWPQQARLLATGALTDHARAILKGETPSYGDEATVLAAWMEKLPRLVAPGAGDALYAGTRPPGLPEPAQGESDDLTRIRGIYPALAARLNGLGIWDLRQIAHWGPEHARWIGAYLAVPGAPERQSWIAQARALSPHAAISS